MSAQARPEGRGRVLLIDDDPETRDALTEFLSMEGYQPTTAANGLEGLEALRSAPLPGLILLDLSMPLMNGFEFRAHQLEDPQLAGIPVVVLTAGGLAAKAPKGLEVLTKPVDILRLLNLISHHLSSRSRLSDPHHQANQR
jgi:CheY-like chemotaxis protein